jgi:DNA invertase Pin-like site-specific DNA recombinase
MLARAYLRASTSEQDATRARNQVEAFAAERGLRIAGFYVENVSGASLASQSCSGCSPTPAPAMSCLSNKSIG